MASEPDDYQTISDNCPGYMVLISEGIVCTRCLGEKRHRPNDCPKPATAASLAIDNVPNADLDEDGMDNADSEMDSLSETESMSSESTGRSDSSENQITNAGQFDRGGNHLHDTRPPSHAFARPDASRSSIQPTRSTFSSSSHQPPLGHGQIHDIRRSSNVRGSNEASLYLQPRLPHERDNKYGSHSLASPHTHSKPRPGATNSTGLSHDNRHSSSKKWSDKTKKGTRSRDTSIPQSMDYEVNAGRITSKALADTTVKFDFDSTTCPSSFGFGRLPSEAMG